MALPSLLPVSAGSTEQQNIDAAEAAVRAYCGWHVAPVMVQSLVLDGSGTASLFVPTLRLTDVTAAEVSGTVLDVADLEWSESGYLRAAGVWPDKLRAVKVTIEHGFDAVPDVAAIVLAIAARASASPTGVVREQAGAVSVSMSATAPGVSGGVVLMDHERRMLDKYRLPGRV